MVTMNVMNCGVLWVLVPYLVGLAFGEEANLVEDEYYAVPEGVVDKGESEWKYPTDLTQLWGEHDIT